MEEVQLSNIFKLKEEEYKPYLNPVEDYIHQSSNYIAVTHKISYAEAKNYVIKALKEFKIKNPIVTYRKKQDNGDMKVEHTPLTQYLKDTKNDQDIIAPSFTRYYHPTKVNSVQKKLLKKNVARRKVSKHLSFKYERENNRELFMFYNDDQSKQKIENNSLSGSYASPSTVLYNPSAHYTLTSITRSVSGIGNILQEAFVGGNKMYITPASVTNYIACILTYVNMVELKIVIDKYQLHLPTTEEIIPTILKSSQWYWVNDRAVEYIRITLNKLNPYQRAAFLYVNDLWHIKEFNDGMVRKFIEKLSNKVEEGSVDYLQDLNDEIEGTNILAQHIYANDIKGLEINYKEMKERNDPLLPKLASTAKNIKETFAEYADFIRVFFVTPICPINTAYIKEMMRFNIVLSDTDSTCCSYDGWVKWFSGNLKVDDRNIGVSASVMTMACLLVEHHINMFASNLNTGKREKTVLAMKNEYFWPVFVNSNVTKHYYATTYIREGNVFAKPKQEIKGVQLIGSTLGGNIVSYCKEIMDDITRSVVENGKVEQLKYVKLVAELEQKIMKDFENGETYMFKKDSIKPAEAYKDDEEKSKYINYIMWEDVFSPDYGRSPAPPYGIYTLPLTIHNKTTWGEFLSYLQENNHSMYIRMQEFCNKYNKDMISTFRAPSIIIDNSGLPKEIRPFVDLRKNILQGLSSYYMVLETIGYYKKPGYLISELGIEY